MFEEWNDDDSNEGDGPHMYVEQGVLERILMEHGGTGTTAEDAEAYLDQVGADIAIVSLMWIRIEQFRLRFGKVLNDLEVYVVKHPEEDTQAMAANAEMILSEFVELCDMAGLIESHSILAVYPDED